MQGTGLSLINELDGILTLKELTDHSLKCHPSEMVFIVTEIKVFSWRTGLPTFGILSTK